MNRRCQSCSRLFNRIYTFQSVILVCLTEKQDSGNRGINEINNAADRYAFVSQETYHIRLSSITGYDSAFLYSQLILINKQRYFRQSP